MINPYEAWPGGPHLGALAAAMQQQELAVQEVAESEVAFLLLLADGSESMSAKTDRPARNAGTEVK